MTLATTTKSRLHITGRSRSRVAWYCSLVEPRAAIDEAIDRPVDQSEQAAALCSPADRRPADRRNRRRGGRCGPRRCSGRARPRFRARANASPATPRRARAAPTRRKRPNTTADARPPISSTSPAGDEVHRDEQRRPGHAQVEVAGDGQVAGELGIFQVAHPRRSDAGVGQTVVKPGGRAVAEIGSRPPDGSA